MRLAPLNALCALSMVAALAACKTEDPRLESMTLEQKIAQKLAVDLRYFCGSELEAGDKCREPVTQLSPALGAIIGSTQVGGVILFAENFSTPEKTLQLVDDLQQARGSGWPLLVATDQEGGKVARLAREWAPAFSGNMAIAATGARGVTYAEQVGQAQAQQLSALGIFINYAPTVDVNANPDNPVINTRSYGESPEQVAALGGAYTRGLQAGGVAATLKHFPGHGDTHVDSHTGLPLVDHSKDKIQRQDLAPFAAIIARDNPALVMTAHIQYPALDSSKVLSHTGEPVVVPATLSRTIMTDLLRTELGFTGVTTTDALDMVGVAMLIPDPLERTILAFNAGVDVALMPFKIRTPADGKRLKALIDGVAKAVRTGRLNATEIDQSVSRIINLKQQLPIDAWLAQDLAVRKQHAVNMMASDEHRALERALALAAVTRIKGERMSLPERCQRPSRLYPDGPDGQARVVIVAPSADVQQALAQAFVQQLPTLSTQAFTLKDYADPARRKAMLSANCLVLASVTPAGSPVDVGGMDDVVDQMRTDAAGDPNQWAALKAAAQSQVEQLQFSLLRQAHQRGIATVFLSLRAPYEATYMAPVSDAIYATYDFNTATDGVRYTGPAYQALVTVLAGRSEASGRLPVTLNAPDERNSK